MSPEQNLSQNKMHCTALHRSLPSQGVSLCEHKWKGLAGCATCGQCKRLERYCLCRFRKGGFSWPSFSQVPCPCSLVSDWVLQSLAAVRCWHTCDIVCTGLCGGNSSCGLMPELVGHGATATAQAVLQPFTLHLFCMEKCLAWVCLS